MTGSLLVPGSGGFSFLSSVFLSCAGVFLKSIEGDDLPISALCQDFVVSLVMLVVFLLSVGRTGRDSSMMPVLGDDEISKRHQQIQDVFY